MAEEEGTPGKSLGRFYGNKENSKWWHHAPCTTSYVFIPAKEKIQQAQQYRYSSTGAYHSIHFTKKQVVGTYAARGRSPHQHYTPHSRRRGWCHRIALRLTLHAPRLPSCFTASRYLVRSRLPQLAPSPTSTRQRRRQSRTATSHERR